LRSLLCHTRGLSNATRLINSLDIELRRYHPDQFPRTGTGGFHQNTFFLHLFVTSCEEGDEYKSLIRRQIQDWLGTVSVKKHQEWLIVHLANQGKGNGGKTFLSSIAAVGGSVPDKMKADVATWAPNRKDR
jgi:hypothetical protein